jgi:hypothetical protein
VGEEFYRTKATWHGTQKDPNRGWYAIVRRHGPLGGLVGERLRLTQPGSHIAPYVVYVIADAETLDEELSLTRHAFMCLGGAYLDWLDLRAEVLP